MATVETITINLPAENAQRIIHALCVSAGHETETLECVRLALVDHITRTVFNVEQSEAMHAAQQAAQPGNSLPNLGL